VHPILAKFRKDRGGEAHGGRLVWGPGTDGIPMRMPTGSSEPAPLLRDDEVDSLPLSQDFNSGTFRMSNPEDAKRYHWIMDRVLAGWFTCYSRHPMPNPVTGEMVWYVEWSQNYHDVT